MKKIFGLLLVLSLVSAGTVWAATASDAAAMTRDETVNYIKKQLNEHGVPYPGDPYLKGSIRYSFDDSQVAVTTETSGKHGWTQKTVVTLHLPYLNGYSVTAGKLLLTVKENSGGITSTVDHTSVNGREEHEKWTPDRMAIEFDDYEVARRVGNAIKHLADLCSKQSKLADNDPFK